MSSSGMGGGGKSATFELNLVPFIDLLSTLICFLLITAVWQEVDSVSSNVPPKATVDQPDTPTPPPPENEKKAVLIVSLGTSTTDFSENEKLTSIPYVGGEPDIQKVSELLREWKTRYPDRMDLIFATDNKAKYKHLVQLMDIFVAEKFPDVGINLN